MINKEIKKEGLRSRDDNGRKGSRVCEWEKVIPKNGKKEVKTKTLAFEGHLLGIEYDLYPSHAPS